MAKITRIRRDRDLCGRRSITIELPEFLLCALEHRVAEANATPPLTQQVTVEHLVELQLADGLSIGEVAFLKLNYPGISDAVSRWFSETRT
jgi:hypothetical protein